MLLLSKWGALLLLTLLSKSCFSQNSPSSLYEVKDQCVRSKLMLEAQVMPFERYTLKAPGESELIALGFHYGDYVQKNQLLLRFSSKGLKKKIRASKSALEALLLEYENNGSRSDTIEIFKARENIEVGIEQYRSTKERFKKTKYLFEQGIISQDELDREKKALLDLKRNLRIQKQSYQRLQARRDTASRLIKTKIENERLQLKELQSQTEKLTIYSPFEGIILPPLSERGGSKEDEPLMIGRTYASEEIIGSLAKLDHFVARVRLSELDALSITKRECVDVQLHHQPHIYKGQIIEVKPILAPQTEQYQASNFHVSVLVDADMEASKILFGRGAKLTIYQNIKTHGWVIPQKAMFYENDFPYCWILKDKEWIRRRIKIGLITDDGIEVLEGLKRGDCVKYPA